MGPLSQAIGVELVVEDLDRAVQLFTEVLGLELASAGPATTVVGRVAVVDAGALAITLLEPASSGPGNVLADRAPRLSQLVFGVEVGGLDTLLERATDAGLAVQLSGPGAFYVSPESAAGALGQRTAVVVTTVGDAT